MKVHKIFETPLYLYTNETFLKLNKTCDKYIKQAKDFYARQQKFDEKSEKVEVDGIFVPKKLLNKKNDRTCPICNIYSFSKKDDAYMNKFECCFKCYIQHIENREERWQSGWRPQGD